MKFREVSPSEPASIVLCHDHDEVNAVLKRNPRIKRASVHETTYRNERDRELDRNRYILLTQD